MLVALLLTAAGCSRQAAAPPARPALFGNGEAKGAAARVVPVAEAGRLYAAFCSSCHGEDGKGNTRLAEDLDPVPSDLSRCNFKYRSTPSGSLPTDRDLLRTLYVGLPGTAMPGFARLLPLPALRGLARQVKQRCLRFAEERPDRALPLPNHADAVAARLEASAERGRKVYRREGCHSCHGEQGRGDGVAAGPLKDAQGRPIRPRDHTRGVFRSGFTALDVYRAFSTGLDGTPMPALPEAVSAGDRWDLTRYLLSLSQRRNRLWRWLSQEPDWYDPALTWRRP